LVKVQFSPGEGNRQPDGKGVHREGGDDAAGKIKQTTWRTPSSVAVKTISPSRFQEILSAVRGRGVSAISGTLVKSSPDRCGYGFAFSQRFPLQNLEPSVHF
jgi:hypothetical protein